MSQARSSVCRRRAGVRRRTTPSTPHSSRASGHRSASVSGVYAARRSRAALCRRDDMTLLYSNVVPGRCRAGAHVLGIGGFSPAPDSGGHRTQSARRECAALRPVVGRGGRGHDVDHSGACAPEARPSRPPKPVRRPLRDLWHAPDSVVSVSAEPSGREPVTNPSYRALLDVPRSGASSSACRCRGSPNRWSHRGDLVRPAAVQLAAAGRACRVRDIVRAWWSEPNRGALLDRHGGCA